MLNLLTDKTSLHFRDEYFRSSNVTHYIEGCVLIMQRKIKNF